MRKSGIIGGVALVALAGAAYAAAGGKGMAGDWLVQLPAAGTASTPAAASSKAPVAELKAGDKIAGSYICVFRARAVGRGNERAEAVRSANAGGGNVSHVYSTALQGFAVQASAQGVANMQARNPNIAYCEQDQVASIIDPVGINAKPGGGGGTPPAQTVPVGIARVGGGTTTAAGIAWVIDTGIDLNHPDLIVDTVLSRNFVARESSAEDTNGHGTHVAGTIGAVNNSIGVVGVAPGTRIAAVRVLNRRGTGSYADIIAGVDYVAATGRSGDVANMSLGGGASQALDNAVIAAASNGIVFALAAGNESTSATTKSPARANGPNIVTVSAVDRNDVWASFSNFGNPPVDWAAPGVSIQSTWKDGGYNTISGTSMATPHVAGLFLLGAVRADGLAINDPDGNRDPIAHR